MVGVAGVREADVCVAAAEVEVDPRRGGHAELVEPSPAQLQRVDAERVGEVGDVGVHVERTVGRRDVGEPGAGEAVDQQRAVRAVARDVAVELVGAVERGEPATWQTCGAQMYRFCCSRSTVATRCGGTTIQPSRQPVIEKYFEKLLTTTASVPNDSAVSARPS